MSILVHVTPDKQDLHLAEAQTKRTTDPHTESLSLGLQGGVIIELQDRRHSVANGVSLFI